ncbi:MBL fold metallo-hydrolase [Aneurinibacillus aneurinilyticus]|jgi:ribonuclease BN (tRNA processing enzyme)|uniref:MBL fold metallo-hydrolase n=1 Tax=Aneurinibacillus aneurinilyticus TaxID=1391 RepID=UPI0023F850F9|nr:MBL fold metallo-hydrolase [Aneurinibacillus aneurinilyticus]MCI1692893.1 MBL fold metallo-hydrolase [Aneurinibacillus aneurinilyticus]
MKLTVLGHQSPTPGPGGATPGYLLETAQGKILIDCGSGVYAQMMKHIHIEELTAVVLSHYHHDHICDMPILQYGVMMAEIFRKRSGTMPIFGPAEPQDWAKKMNYQKYTQLRTVKEKDTLTIAGVEFSFLRTDHPLLCYAMKITDGKRTIVYGADTGPETNWSGFADGCDLFICEATFIEAYLPKGKRGHLSAREAAQTAQRLGVKQLLITHLSPDIDRTAYEKEAATGGFTGTWQLADIGQVIEL